MATNTQAQEVVKVNPVYEELLASGKLEERQVEICVVMLSNRAKYPDGMTAREINSWMKYQYTSHSGVHSRLRELAKIGLVKKLPTRRRCPVSHRLVTAWCFK